MSNASRIRQASLIFTFGLLAVPAFAVEPYGQATYASIPCDGDATGSVLIISRPPTVDELTGVPDGDPPLLVERDHLTCNGSIWELTSTVPLFRGGQ